MVLVHFFYVLYWLDPHFVCRQGSGTSGTSVSHRADTQQTTRCLDVLLVYSWIATKWSISRFTTFLLVNWWFFLGQDPTFSNFRAHVLTLDQLVNLTFPHVCSLNHQKSIVFEVNNLLSRVQIPMFLTEILTCWERISCWPPLECTGTLQPELVPNFHHFHHFCSSFSIGKSPDFHHFLCRSSNFHHFSIIFPRYHLVI